MNSSYQTDLTLERLGHIARFLVASVLYVSTRAHADMQRCSDAAWGLWDATEKDRQSLP